MRRKSFVYTLGGDKKSFESLKVPLIIMGPAASGDYKPLAISDGFLEFNNVSREDFYGYYGDRVNDGLFEKVHPDQRKKLRAISRDFLDRKTEYDITFRVRRDDGYHLIHSIGYWQTMEDGTDLALIIYSDVQKHEDILLEISDKYKVFQKDEFYIDALTNLPNINFINKHGNVRIQEIVSEGGTPMLVYLDIDSMQSYNRKYGVQREMNF